jgi:hypothetical protein
MKFAYLATLPLINLPTDGTRQDTHFVDFAHARPYANKFAPVLAYSQNSRSCVKGMILLARFTNPDFNH